MIPLLHIVSLVYLVPTSVTVSIDTQSLNFKLRFFFKHQFNLKFYFVLVIFRLEYTQLKFGWDKPFCYTLLFHGWLVQGQSCGSKEDT